MTEHKLTQRQQAILDFVDTEYARTGLGLTVREIQAGAGLSSTSVVSYNVKKLAPWGLLHWEPEISRSIRPVKATEPETIFEGQFYWKDTDFYCYVSDAEDEDGEYKSQYSLMEDDGANEFFEFLIDKIAGRHGKLVFEETPYSEGTA